MILLRALRRLGRAIWFVAYFHWELVVANAVVVWEVITPRHYMRPGIIEVPIRCERNREIVLLANLISLTPGTLTLEVSEDRTKLYVHGMHILTPDDLRARVRRLEDRLLAVLR